jgi:hypothetical protein
MTKTVLYKYLGTNGIIISPVHLEDTYYIRQIRLTAGKGKKLTDGYKVLESVTIPEEEVENWSEIDAE